MNLVAPAQLGVFAPSQLAYPSSLLLLSMAKLS